MEKEQEEELLNPERELTMEDLRRFRAECCLEYVVAQFRDKRSWRPGPEDWVRLYWAILGPSLLGDRPGSREFHQAASGAGLFDGQGAEDRLSDEGKGPADGDRLALLLFANRHFDDPQAAV